MANVKKSKKIVFVIEYSVELEYADGIDLQRSLDTLRETGSAEVLDVLVRES